ncbi:hypothetical protein SAMN05443543_10698 [Flavobacterium flevense]|uniref:Uncharacterized protein n=1 Tax=Flavobacterium flevense TaxID=983 RepID=A0A4Y4B1T3_9FLAO|nr:hypothetical protein [Flavobacterium flevense]GEC72844.1 hypothetical protein FFL01_23830 [Flavobacterium flevense]SHL87255.1 hypothetical protein SAMN05443543_10698 [Flavobacterium flevense]
MSFDPEIWGTVSDWVMIFVTAATGLLLYLTLTAQLRITKIEQYRHKLNIQPYFSARIDNLRVEKKDGVYTAVIFLRLTVENHKCLPLKYELIEEYELVKTQKELHTNYLGVGEELIHFPVLRILSESEDNILNNRYIASSDLYFYFQDADGRKYKQKFQITIYNGETKIYRRDPVEVYE